MRNVVDKKTRSLISKINRAFRDYPMLSDGDRISVAISGGYDSLSLLCLLRTRKLIMPENYDLIAIHILGDANGPGDRRDHLPLIEWFNDNKIAYVSAPMQLAKDEKLPMSCYRCSWNRRSTLFKVSNRLGCNKLAFGHHFDDMVETALLNLIYQGRMATMYPYASYFGGEFSVIRPLIYITKKELNAFALRQNLPDPPLPCPNADISKRKAVGEVLKSLEKNYRRARWNIFRAAINCMKLEDEKREEDGSESQEVDQSDQK